MQAATPIDDEFDGIIGEIEIPDVRMRNSIKWKIIPSKSVLMLDFVFAHDPIEAEAKARASLEIPEGEEIEIRRVWESSGLNGSAIKGYTSSPHMSE